MGLVIGDVMALIITSPQWGDHSFQYIPWWRHQMEAFSALLAIYAGNSPVTGEFPAQRPVTRNFDVFFDLRLNKSRANNHETGDLRRHDAHYDVTAMRWPFIQIYTLSVNITYNAMYYCRVMVLSEGKVMEFDTPSALLNDEGSIFKSMCYDKGLSSARTRWM